MQTAFLVDGGFFLKRFRSLRGTRTPAQVAADLYWMCREHLKAQERPREQMYRIFYYDCPPLTKKAHNPITKQPLDFSMSPTARWRLAFFSELRKLRKVALRLGYLNERSGQWQLRSDVMRDLLAQRRTIADLDADSVYYEVRQKGVDMRIGVDIASMAFKGQVDQMILIAGDSDFVPAAKLARREGVDFVLDPMWASIRPDLHEHIDGLHSVIPRPRGPRDRAGAAEPPS